MRRRYLRERREIGGGQVGEGRHAGAGIAVLEIGAQLLGGLRGDARIHGEAGPLRGAARILAVTGGAADGEDLLCEELRREEEKCES